MSLKSRRKILSPVIKARQIKRRKKGRILKEREEIRAKWGMIRALMPANKLDVRKRREKGRKKRESRGRTRVKGKRRDRWKSQA